MAGSIYHQLPIVCSSGYIIIHAALRILQSCLLRLEGFKDVEVCGYSSLGLGCVQGLGQWVGFGVECLGFGGTLGGRVERMMGAGGGGGGRVGGYLKRVQGQ